MSAYEGKVVVVTGGTGALGQAVVEHLLRAGARVRIPVRDERAAKESAFAADDRVELSAPVELADAGHVDAFYGTGSAPWASIHLAGGFEMAPIEETTPESFDKMYRNNALSCFLCCRAAVRRMRAAGSGGRIVNVGARPALFPELAAHKIAYVASKAAVVAMTTALGAELAGEGIWVNAVVPELIDTPANRAAMPKADHARWPSPADLAETIAFLASPNNRATRSALVPVYGRS